MKGNPRTLAAAAAAAVLTKKRHGAAGVKRGAAFVPFFLSGEAVAVEDPLQGGFHHPAAGVRNQQKPPLHFPRRVMTEMPLLIHQTQIDLKACTMEECLANLKTVRNL